MWFFLYFSHNIFKEYDIVSIHLPLNYSTGNLISTKELSSMKPSSYLINTARAEIVNANSLYNIFKNDKIAGCAFDGFYQEPINLKSNESKLLSLPIGKFILTPHTGYNAIERTERVEKCALKIYFKLLTIKSVLELYLTNI